MEKRALIAIVVAFIIIYFYQAYLVPKPPAVPVPQPSEQRAAPKDQSVEKPQASAIIPAETTPPPSLPSADREFKIRVETTLYKAVFTNKGGRLFSLRLKTYHDEAGRPLELVCQDALGKNLLPFAVFSQDAAKAKEINDTYFSVDQDTVDVPAESHASLTMAAHLPSGSWVSKKFEFASGSYEVKVEISSSSDLRDLSIALGPGLGNPTAEQLKNRRTIRGIVVYEQNGKVQRLHQKDAQELGFVNWLGVEDNYFILLARFSEPVQAAATAPIQDLNKISSALIRGIPQKPFMIYVGPKDYTLLKQLGSGMDRLIDYGWFGILAKPLLIALRFLYIYVHNYGLAIIILTLAIKIILFPLTFKSTVSMLKMQKLQPEMNAIRERFSKKKSIEDRQQMNAEVMKLYKDRGINPMGGCIPILFQLPVLVAFYNLLSVSIELRNAPFIFWIHDLSSRDPYYITPILMGLTQLIMQRMTPSPADPMQAKMMMIMPIFFTILFFNVQSGLVLYWTVNNVLSIVQQYLMGRMGVVPTRVQSLKKK